jgi:hypothetical protein
MMERTMSERQFGPVNSGWVISVPRLRGGTVKQEVRRQAGPPATHDQDIEKAFDVAQDTGEGLRRQAYPIRFLKQRCGLSRNCAAFVAAEFRWGGA